MAAAPGWYDAGVPGQLRWWDGARWTDQVAGVPVPGSQHPQPGLGAVPGVVPGVTLPSTAPTAAPDSVPGDALSAATGAAMGWYPTPAGPLRWWDGSRWTGLRVKNGNPGTDWAATEQPVLAFTVGGFFLVLALAQVLFSSSLSLIALPWVGLAGVTTLLMTALFLARGAQTVAVRRIPAPSGQPSTPDVVQPLPGIVEGPGAGWEPLTPLAKRWWTGARWTHYMATRYGVRPTFHGPRSYRVLVITAWVIFGLGLGSVIVGIALLVIGAEPVNALLTSIGGGLLILGIVLSVAGVPFFILTRSGRRLLLLPKDAPQQTPGG